MAHTSIVRFGKTLASPIINLGSWYNATAKAHPVLTGVITSGLKTGAADIFAQKVIERREEIDWKKNLVYCLFGFSYLGGFQYYLYNVKFTQWCSYITKVVGHRGAAPVKTFLDQCIHHPLGYFPAFFALKSAIEGKPMSHAVDKYRNEAWDNIKALWTIWVPAQMVNFMFVPRHLRVPFVAGVSFLWTVVFSVMQGKFDSAADLEAKLEEVAQEPIMLPPAPSPISIKSGDIPKGFAASGIVNSTPVAENKTESV